MNSSLLSKINLVILLLGMTLSLMACSGGDRGTTVRTSRTASDLTAGNVGGSSGTAASCPTPGASVGKIYSSSAGVSFESQVKAFVSATLDPAALGTVSGDMSAPTGIDFTGALAFDNAGNLIAGSSNINIKIFDSYVGQVVDGETIQAYLIQFGAATSGTLDRQMRQFQVKYSDSYGDIVFQGQYEISAQGLAQGIVTFQNRVAVNGYTPASGTLGNFKILTCAFIK